MTPKFSFEGALSAPFKSAHASSFPWLFALSYAAIATALMALFVYVSRDTIGEFISAIEALENADIDEDDPGAVMSMVFGTMTPLIPYAIIGTLVSWVVYGMFQAASMRRYIRDEPFRLSFGGDELRMMIVGLMWWLLGIMIFIIPIGVMWSGFSVLFSGDFVNLSDSEVESRVLGSMFGGMGLMLLFFPVYVFLATRLAPCFGLTMKEREIRFFDAWNVSRGRFWPILGAFLILAIVITIVAAIIDQVLQLSLLQTVVPQFMDIDSSDDLMAVLSSGSFLTMMGIYIFLSSIVSGVQLHFIHAPAAFAARHDPRGGVDDAQQVDIFS